MTQGPYSEEIKAKVIELHTVHRLGLKAIAKYFNNKPAKTTVEKILSKAGVYRGPERMAEQQKAREKRQREVLEKEKEGRHRVAVCLWNLRNGVPVERTCKDNGWGHKSAWNRIRQRPSYHRLRAKIERPYKFTRIEQRKRLISRIYPTEDLFAQNIECHLRDFGDDFEVEPSIPGTRLRADFRFKGFLIECKVDTTHNKLKICIGQACIYRHIGSSQPVVIIPDDVDMRHPFDKVLRALDVVLLSETEFISWIRTQGG